MNSPIVFKTTNFAPLFLGISLSCALGALAAPQMPNFSDEAKDRHVGKMLLPASPTKPIEPSSTSVIKTSSTQGKAQALLDSLKGNGGQSKTHAPIVAPVASSSKTIVEQKPEVKGASDSARNSGKAEKSSRTQTGASETTSPLPSKGEAAAKSAGNAPDKKTGASVKGTADKDEQSKESKAKPDDKSATSEAADKSTKSSSRSQHFRAKSFDGFIPPPPPVQPSILMTGDMNGPGVMPFTVEYMNKDELLQKQKELESQLSDAKDQLKDTEEAGAEKKTRAERFDPLYKEGVVSRHELEAAQKEALEVDKEVDRAKNRVTDLQNQSASVDRKLKEIAKRTLPVSASPRKRVKK